MGKGVLLICFFQRGGVDFKGKKPSLGGVWILIFLEKRWENDLMFFF